MYVYPSTQIKNQRNEFDEYVYKDCLVLTYLPVCVKLLYKVGGQHFVMFSCRKSYYCITPFPPIEYPKISLYLPGFLIGHMQSLFELWCRKIVIVWVLKSILSSSHWRWSIKPTFYCKFFGFDLVKYTEMMF